MIVDALREQIQPFLEGIVVEAHARARRHSRSSRDGPVTRRYCFSCSRRCASAALPVPALAMDHQSREKAPTRSPAGAPQVSWPSCRVRAPTWPRRAASWASSCRRISFTSASNSRSRSRITSLETRPSPRQSLLLAQPRDLILQVPSRSQPGPAGPAFLLRGVVATNSATRDGRSGICLGLAHRCKSARRVWHVAQDG